MLVRGYMSIYTKISDTLLVLICIHISYCGQISSQSRKAPQTLTDNLQKLHSHLVLEQEEMLLLMVMADGKLE